MEELLSRLNITLRGDYDSNGNYIIDIPNSNEYGKIFTKLDRSSILEEDSTASSQTYEKGTIRYESNNFELLLDSDWDRDIYTLTIKEK